MNVKGDQQQREGASSWAVEGGRGRGDVLEGEKGKRKEGKREGGSERRTDRWIREVEVKTKSGSSAWGGYDFCWTLAAQADPLGSWAAGQQGRAARPAESTEGTAKCSASLLAEKRGNWTILDVRGTEHSLSSPVDDGQWD